jgi:hypothetical protein
MHGVGGANTAWSPERVANDALGRGPLRQRPSHENGSTRLPAGAFL